MKGTGTVVRKVRVRWGYMALPEGINVMLLAQDL